MRPRSAASFLYLAHQCRRLTRDILLRCSAALRSAHGYEGLSRAPPDERQAHSPRTRRRSESKSWKDEAAAAGSRGEHVTRVCCCFSVSRERKRSRYVLLQLLEPANSIGVDLRKINRMRHDSAAVENAVQPVVVFCRYWV